MKKIDIQQKGFTLLGLMAITMIIGAVAALIVLSLI